MKIVNHHYAEWCPALASLLHPPHSGGSSPACLAFHIAGPSCELSGITPWTMVESQAFLEEIFFCSILPLELLCIEFPKKESECFSSVLSVSQALGTRTQWRP